MMETTYHEYNSKDSHDVNTIQYNRYSFSKS